MVPIGENVTLHCHSQLGFEMFRLFKEDVVNIREFQDILFQQYFDMYPVTMAHGGTYRCQGFDPKAPYALSEISDPLLIIVTGAYRKPSLLALPAPSVKSGEMVTLQCCSETMFETFILVVDKEGVPLLPTLHILLTLHKALSSRTTPWAIQSEWVCQAWSC
ncbi:killer cell immunoglobulin-like receptor 3DL1 [Acomys russatus]|uniref:killer cell immunoglobulin-like receptor 3DL1 n=1 Tax=Acomys russatus TaxID=60746 RepID=UPI0021E309C8|nr:killer cell immunoglobulin-like receptor 3DL1 [Acomys russatus]